MQAEELLQFKRQESFRPFRIHLSNGHVYDIRFPELVMVFKNFVIIGIPAQDDLRPIYEHTDYVPRELIDRVELLLPANEAPRK